MPWPLQIGHPSLRAGTEPCPYIRTAPRPSGTWKRESSTCPWERGTRRWLCTVAVTFIGHRAVRELPLHPNPSHRPRGKARIYRRGEFQARQTQSTCRHRAKVTGPLTSQEDIFAGHQQNACLLTQKETASPQGSRRASAAHAGAVVSTIHKRPRFVERAPL